MDEETKDKLKKAAKDSGHVLGDIADVAGHTVAGTVKGVADGVEAVSDHDKQDEGKS